MLGINALLYNLSLHHQSAFWYAPLYMLQERSLVYRGYLYKV